MNSPTPTQTASEVWLSLIHGANAIGYFIHVLSPSFREDGVFNDPTMVAALTSLNPEIKALAPELNSANITGLVSVSSSNASAPIDSMVKSNGNSIYIFSAISRPGTATGTFTINGMSGNGIVDVVNEHRTLPVTAGTFSDSFAANGSCLQDRHVSRDLQLRIADSLLLDRTIQLCPAKSRRFNPKT